MSVAEPISGREVDLILTELEVSLPSGTETYLLPLAIAWEDEHRRCLAAAARLGAGAARPACRVSDRRLRQRCAADRGAAGAGGLGGAAARQRRDPFLPTARLAEIEFPRTPDIRRLSAEQSNSSLIVGDLAVFKLVRRVFPGSIPRPRWAAT